MILLGIVYGLNRNFVYLEPARALKEHLGLVFEPFTLAVNKVLHEIKRDAAKTGLCIADLDSGYIRKELYRDVVAHAALPGHIFPIELTHTQNERVRIILKRADDGSDAFRGVLAVGIGSHTSKCIRHILRYV